MADAPPPWRATSRLMAGVLGGLKAACAAGGWFRKTLENGSRYSGFDINLLPAKIGLDNGVHFPSSFPDELSNFDVYGKTSDKCLAGRNGNLLRSLPNSRSFSVRSRLRLRNSQASRDIRLAQMGTAILTGPKRLPTILSPRPGSFPMVAAVTSSPTP